MNRVIALFILLLATFCVQAQVITGKVVDAGSGKPIANASVYLNGTSKGTSSDKEGKFTLITAEHNIPLIISCVGYQSQTITNYANANLSISLQVKPMTLPEVVIGGMSREEQLKIFLTQFIGSTSKDCIISNTIDINFNYHKKTKTLEADASEPLHIYNKKLRYIITYYLSYFKYTPDEINYQGNYFFQDDTAGLTPNELKKIHKARDEAYFGSRMHFIRSLWANSLQKNNYFISDTSYYSAETIADGIKRYGQVYTLDKRIHERDFYNYLVKVYNGEKYIAPKRPLIIKYRNNTSYLQIDTNSKQVLIGSNGYYDMNVTWSGPMASQRVNVLLPFEFQPSGSNSLFVPTEQPQAIPDQNLRGDVVLLSAVQQLKPIEKLYLQTDKSYYTTGDTLRFKGYLLNGDYLTPAERSGLLYVELDGTDGKAAKRIMVPIEQGLAWGDIALDGKDISEGSYTLRAYTNWQRNFGEDYIFKKDISIAAINGESLLVKAGFAQKDGKVESILQFTSLDGHVQVLKDMQLKVMNGRKNLSKDKLTTGVDGTVKVNFATPEGANIKDLSIKAQDVSKGIVNAQELSIPVTINRMENTDIQFMPEGGKLVAGIKTRVGFKAIAEDGKGTNITGKITDSKQKELASIKTSHAGMGSFTFTPKANETYTVKINGISKPYNLPAVNTAGTTLSVEQTANSDSLRVTISATADVKGTYYLIGQSRGVVCYAQTITFDKDQTIKRSVAKDQFPTGIARFTIISQNHQPVNERQVFINHQDNLNITIETDKTNYTTRDSVGLIITIKDKTGNPVQGNFSLAVTDDSQVKTDSLSANIISNLLLTSDLKGNIEEPNYYFINANQKQTDLDNLLLTQGWVGYDWQDVFYPSNKPIAYQHEKEFTVNGTVTNAFGKPIEKSGVTLLLNKSLTMADTLTDNLGRFTFTGLFPLDSAVINLQSRNKRGKEFNVGMEVDEFKAPEFKPLLKWYPWYLNSDSLLLKNTQTKAAQLQAVANYNGEGKTLKEVIINAKRIIKGSKNLNGPGEADEVIDEKTMNDAGNLSLYQFIQQRYKSFYPYAENKGRNIFKTFQLLYHMVQLVIDGIYITKYDDIKNNLDYLSAADVKGIEIMNSSRYATAYNPNYIAMVVSIPDRWVPIYLEITTYSGNGALYKKTPGIYLYRPMPFTLPIQFYSPKYTIKSRTIAPGTDMRSTLHWEPNVITGADGKANVSFFTADKPANYTLIIEGMDLNGGMGYKKHQLIKVKLR